MLYDVKAGLANLQAFSVPYAIVRLRERLKKCAWTVGWPTSISGAHAMHVHGGGLDKLAHCGRSLHILSTSANQRYFNNIGLTLKHAGYLINASMEAWGGEVQNPKKHGA